MLDTLGLTELVTGIPGVSAVGAATILAEAGDPTRFSSARALVKHAGPCPRANESGNYAGTTSISGRGRPELRLAAWRAVFTALQHNPVLAARHAHLTGRAENPLTDTQARIAVAASLLRHLHAVVVTHTLAPRRRRPRPEPRDGAAAAACHPSAADHRAGRARIAVGTPSPQLTLSSPARLPASPDEGCREQPA